MEFKPDLCRLQFLSNAFLPVFRFSKNKKFYLRVNWTPRVKSRDEYEFIYFTVALDSCMKFPIYRLFRKDIDMRLGISPFQSPIRGLDKDTSWLHADRDICKWSIATQRVATFRKGKTQKPGNCFSQNRPDSVRWEWKQSKSENLTRFSCKSKSE